jgi:endonuclease/exonuclease/phosphatase family metal-dependent hydrolase
MTFNLRFENDTDGPNAWVYRRETVIRLIQAHRPSVLGTQEGRMSQLAYLKEHLPEYYMAAPERVLDDTCQYPTLFCLRKDVVVHDVHEFWLSDTPKVHRSKSWGSGFPRMMSAARVSVGAGDGFFWIVVTHLDHIGMEARQNQARMIAEWVKDANAPVILMGDFNDSPGSKTHEILISPETGLQDTWSALGCPEDVQSYTVHRFTGLPQKARIDWILASSSFWVKDTCILREGDGDPFPSDHFPYMAQLEEKAPDMPSDG